MRRLYEVTHTRSVVVLAESEDAALKIAAAQCDEAYDEEAEVISCSTGARYLPGGWEPQSLVYHAGNYDITLDEAIKLSIAGNEAEGVDDEEAEQ